MPWPTELTQPSLAWRLLVGAVLIFVLGFLAGRIDLPATSTQANVQPSAQRSMDSTMDPATRRLLERSAQLADRCDVGVQGQRQPRS